MGNGEPLEERSKETRFGEPSDIFGVPTSRNNASLYRKRNATFNKAGGRNFFKSFLSFYFSANFSTLF